MLANRYELGRAAHRLVEGSLNKSTWPLAFDVPIAMQRERAGYRFDYDSEAENYTVEEWAPYVDEAGEPHEKWTVQYLPDWLAGLAVATGVQTDPTEIDMICEELIDRIDELGVVH